MQAEDYMLPCISKSLFGIECLGCGSQRALLLVFQGKFTEAFAMYPAIYTLLILIMVVVLNFIDKSRNYTKSIKFLAFTNLLIMIVSYFINHF